MIRNLIVFVFIFVCLIQEAKSLFSLEPYLCCRANSMVCGAFVEECCIHDAEGCYWFFWCPEKQNTFDCIRIKTIVEQALL